MAWQFDVDTDLEKWGKIKTDLPRQFQIVKVFLEFNQQIQDNKHFDYEIP